MNQRLLRRLRGITTEEISWRAAAGASTLAERIRYVAHRPSWDRNRRAYERAAERLRSRPSRFVLDPASQESMREQVLTRWPDAARDARARADRTLAGSFDLLGYRDLPFAGADGRIDWQLDPVHQRRAPVRFWADVPYLDPAIGDHKIIWELNRHQHWLLLGRASWLTGDARYAQAIVDQLHDWIAANPPRRGINWASMLEIGLRSISWIWAMHFLLAFGSRLPALDGLRPEPRAKSPEPTWLVDMLIGLDVQARHLESHLSYYFSPNTHLTGEALGLYVLGLSVPELAGSERWTSTGRRILLSEIERQILPDGGHVERSTHYQRYTLDFYLMALVMARRAGDAEAAQQFERAATRLADYTRTMADDRGELPLIGDDDGGTLWRFTGRGCNDVRDSLALAAVLLDRPDLAPWGPTEDVCWLAGPEAIAHTDHKGPRNEIHGSCGANPYGSPSPLRSRAFPDSGYVVMRNGRGDHLVFDAGAHGYMNGGHAHADALAVTLSTAQGPLLVDPGTATYTMSAALRDRMRASASHNTVTIDGRTQSEPAGPFHWRTRTDATLAAFIDSPALDAVEGWHDGYASVRHRRRIARIGDSGWLIVDEFTGAGEHTAEAHWHFDPHWMVANVGAGLLRMTHETGFTSWLLHDGDAVSLTHGDEGDEPSWYAPAYGTLIPTWTARITTRRAAPWSLVTWIDTTGAAIARAPHVESRVEQESLWAS